MSQGLSRAEEDRKGRCWRARDAENGLLPIFVQDDMLCVEYSVAQAP